MNTLIWVSIVTQKNILAMIQLRQPSITSVKGSELRHGSIKRLLD